MLDFLGEEREIVLLLLLFSSDVLFELVVDEIDKLVVVDSLVLV